MLTVEKTKIKKKEVQNVSNSVIKQFKSPWYPPVFNSYAQNNGIGNVERLGTYLVGKIKKKAPGKAHLQKLNEMLKGNGPKQVSKFVCVLLKFDVIQFLLFKNKSWKNTGK